MNFKIKYRTTPPIIDANNKPTTPELAIPNRETNSSPILKRISMVVVTIDCIIKKTICMIICRGFAMNKFYFTEKNMYCNIFIT